MIYDKDMNKLDDSEGLARTFGEFCKMFRLRRALSQYQLADILKCSRGRIVHVESDMYELPLEFAKKLVDHITPAEKKELREILTKAFEAKLEIEGL